MKLRTFTIVLVLFVCFVGFAGCASSNSSQTKKCEDDIASLKIERDHLNTEIQSLKENLASLYKALDSFKFNIALLQKELMELKSGKPVLNSHEAVDALVEQLRGAESDIPKITAQLKGYGKPAIIVLIRQLKDHDITMVKRAESVLLQMPVSEVVPILGESLNQPEVRNSTARILGKIGDQSAIMPLAEQLKSKDPDFLFYVSEALVNLKERRGIPVLIETLKSESAVLRALAFDSLSKITGLDFNYKPYLVPEERERSVKEWESWWVKEGDKFQFK
jgi:HEAT repeat protein